MSAVDQYLAKVTPTFDPPIQEGDYIQYRRYGLIKSWILRPRLGLVKGISENGKDFDVDYPSEYGGEPETVSVYQIIQHIPMDEDINESESSIS